MQLSLNGSVKKLETLAPLCTLPELEDLSIKECGLLSLENIAEKFPKLVQLDLSKNEIFSIKSIEHIKKLASLAELNLEKNPIEVHKHLKNEALDAIPYLEVFNRE